MKILSLILLLSLFFCFPKVQAIGKRCNKPIDQGFCPGRNVDFEDDPELRWFYDAGIDKCKLLAYFRCGGNGNRFDTEEECYTLCVNTDI